MASTLPQLSETGKHLPLASTAHPAGFFSRSPSLYHRSIHFNHHPIGWFCICPSNPWFLLELAGLVEYIKTILENSTYNLAIGAVLATLVVIGYYTFFWTLVRIHSRQSHLRLEGGPKEWLEGFFWQSSGQVFRLLDLCHTSSWAFYGFCGIRSARVEHDRIAWHSGLLYSEKSA